VRHFGGAGRPPAHIQWDGKDETGLPVSDGAYTYRLVVRDQQGRVLDSPIRRVTISTAGPQGDVPITVNP
jgi:flagellar hook assembly protein FlgD